MGLHSSDLQHLSPGIAFPTRKERWAAETGSGEQRAPITASLGHQRWGDWGLTLPSALNSLFMQEAQTSRSRALSELQRARWLRWYVLEALPATSALQWAQH